mgnify:CR=1 FL=1
MTTIRVTNHLNPRGLPAGAEFDTDAATADRWVRRGWGAIVGIHETEQAAQSEPLGVLTGDGTGEALPPFAEPDADGVIHLAEPLNSGPATRRKAKE